MPISAFFRFFIFLTLTIVAVSCSPDKQSNPCYGVNCSEKGTCIVGPSGGIMCQCDEGYHAVSLTCVENDPPPEFITTPDSAGTEGNEYVYNFECAGRDVSVTYNENDTCEGSLQDNDDGTGTYSFTPGEETGDTTCLLALKCTDAYGISSVQELTITIGEMNSAPVIENLPQQIDVFMTHDGSFQATATDSDIPSQELSWDLAGTDCPFEIHFDASGLISWTCTQAGSCIVSISVTDDGSPALSVSDDLTVVCIDNPPEITSEAPIQATEGMQYSYSIECVDPDGDTVVTSVNIQTDDCGGIIDNNVYKFVPGPGISSCNIGIDCSDGRSTDSQVLTVTINPYDGNLQLRIVAANLTSENFQNYDPGHGIRIMQGLAADLILVQEMGYLSRSDTDYRSFAMMLVGTEYYSIDSTAFQLPNGVVSRWPILESGWLDDPTLSNRELFWAIIDLPGPKDLFVFSVHLHTEPVIDQVIAAQVIVDAVTAHKTANPGKYYYVVGGDFNGETSVSTEGFGADGAFCISDPFPVDDNGNRYTNSPRNAHYDWILSDCDMSSSQVSTQYESRDGNDPLEYPQGHVFDTRLYTQEVLDEYFFPALTTDSAAFQMQHMAVIKDYILP
ncbi:hypothetical protein KKF34_15825 [Myxococcota bacterium]|nr:hypothetical protein [Myxococcota bacterium]MBU1381299.1 hypothetical protein [Myxococcota bacterium]MBU1498345.1 hypothetical protein [Myxococcota bacterium]